MAKQSSNRFMRFIWRLMLKLLVLAGIFAFALPYVLRNPDISIKNLSVDKIISYDYAGKVTQWVASFSGDASEQNAQAISDSQLNPSIQIEMTQDESLQKGDVKVYRWQDKNGKWHFSDSPDEKAKNEMIFMNTQANVIQSVKKPVDESKTISFSGGNSDKSSGAKLAEEVLEDDGLSLTTVPLDKIPDLINETKNIQNIMNTRQKQLDGL